jgi:hypothetical protein
MDGISGDVVTRAALELLDETRVSDAAADRHA